MNIRNRLFPTNKFLLGAALLVTLTGCVGYVNGPRAGIYVEPPLVETEFLIQDDYVYYPSYQIYYSSSRHQYAYRDGRRWISRPAPHGVSVRRLEASPFVRLEFHDSPARHHETVVQQYPRNWTPERANQGQNRGNNHDDERGDHQGR
jgi:hypothetical protein